MTGRGRLALGALGGVAACAYVLSVRGSLTIDLRLGRSTRPLGPIRVPIAAPRELVFDVIAAPYLGRTPRALQSKLQVLERGEDMVLAEHFTQVGPVTTTTLETVRFERPERVHFRLARGPAPFVVEVFELHESEGATELEYRGTIGADLWVAGRVWAAAVAWRWEAAVRESLAGIKTEAERRASPESSAT